MVQRRTHQRARLTQLRFALEAGSPSQPTQHFALYGSGAARLGDNEAMHTGPEMIVGIGAYRTSAIGFGLEIESVANELEQPRLELPQQRLRLRLFSQLPERRLIAIKQL